MEAAASIRTATGTELVHYRVEGGVALLELDAPPANTYTYEMFRQLDDAILRARMDNDAHVVVLRGAGEKFFSAGADIKMLAGADPTFKYYFCLHANETLLRLEKTPKLVVAALNGHTVGGGLEIAMACDIRLARRDGGKIGLPEVALGVLPGTGGTQRLARLVGKARALELIATGRTFSFEEALDLGLVHAVVDDPDFMKGVMTYVGQFLPPHKAAKAVGHVKRAIQSGVEVDLYDGLALEQELQIQLFRSDDAREGLDAYVGKRVPRFQGR
jgi:enoyl-CoA hydratase